ncbi:DUF4012 domain-containing protein [Candidatus Daviesbacteria bacterium]|nr:DUF4012 domain-containing protein [Candidatus Daviesbacteria bacterium]
MEPQEEYINRKNSILLSRNNPVALVVGAAGFLGSNLVDGLLNKGIQVVGIDNLTSGRKENLEKAVENKNFHFYIESAEKAGLELSRLDYMFIVSSGTWDLKKVLQLFKQYGCRCLFVSSIDLYQKETGLDLAWLRDSEAKIAKFARDFNLNARILRLGPVYGPRMHFRGSDPIIRLIHEAIKDNLQQEVSLEFSSRALFVSDAVDLMIKTIFAGSTAQKIFDGVLPSPIKVSEIKQVLLDPLWYESRDFIPSELPPWPTPNLEKTVKVLNWHPNAGFISGLRQAVSYFKDNEVMIPDIEVGEGKIKGTFFPSEMKVDLTDEKKKDLEGLKRGKEVKKEEKKEKIKFFNFSINTSKIYLYLILTLITYALIWPMVSLATGVLAFRYQLNAALDSLEKGEFEKSLANLDQANGGVLQAKSIIESFEPIQKLGIFKSEFQLGDNLLNLATLSVASARSSVVGVEALFQSLKSVTGEINESPSSFFEIAQIELAKADTDLSKAEALIKDENFNKNLPRILKSRVSNINEKLTTYSRLMRKARVLSNLLPNVVALNGSKNYLILMQNNMELRPTGGFIGSFAKVSFEGGKLKKLVVNDIYAIDGQLNIRVEPPKEIKEDLGQTNWFLRDSNFEPDFPTSARQAEWFYTKETGERVEGVVALDISAMEELLSQIGPLDLPDYKEKITAENLFEKAVSYAELSFFPGSQAKKSFLTALTNQLFNKLFFLPGQNWPKIVSSIGKSLEQKHLSIYLDDPKLFTYLSSLNWTGILPRQPTSKNLDLVGDFLAPVEANFGANKANYYLDRSYNLETIIGKEGEINQILKITYTNRSPSSAFPAGNYKNRLRLYLPFESKVKRALFGEIDVTNNVASFVDYGRTGYSVLLEIAPKESKTFILDYQIPQKLFFKEGKAKYRLDLIKQAGTLKDPFVWKISYPISFKLASSQAPSYKLGPQEQTISTDLSQDRSFVVEFKK